MSTGTTEIKEDSLPFSEKAQAAFLGYVLKSGELLAQVKGRIQGDWFIDSKMAELYDLYLRFYKDFGRPATDGEFFAWDIVACKDFPKRNALQQAWASAFIQTHDFGSDFLRSQLTKWYRAKIWKAAALRAADFFNAGSLTEAQVVMSEAVKEYESANFEGETAMRFDNPLELVASQEVEHNDALTTGLKVLDEKLNPDCKSGSLLRGDTTIIQAPVNIGKTTTLITIARHNIVRNKAVLFISLEGRPKDIMEKMLCSTVVATRSMFRAAAKDPEHPLHNRVLFAGKGLQKNLTYIPMNKPGLTVEEVISRISSENSKRKALSGTGFDMVVIDYPGILTSSETRKGQDKRHEVDYIYRQFVQWGLEVGPHMLLAAQTNRTASKANRHSSTARAKKNEENKLAGMEDVGEAFGIAQSATNYITLNRDMVAMAKGYLTLGIAKSRSGETDWAVACKSDFGKALAFSNELGATAYRGSDVMSDKIDSLIKEFKGGEVEINRLRMEQGKA